MLIKIGDTLYNEAQLLCFDKYYVQGNVKSYSYEVSTTYELRGVKYKKFLWFKHKRDILLYSSHDYSKVKKELLSIEELIKKERGEETDEISK